MFWDIRETLSYNAFINFVVGNRGSGKTFGCKKWAIQDYVDNKKEFVWVRRFDSEMDDFKHTFFSDIVDEFPENNFVYKGYKFYMDGEVMGHSIPLTISMKKKSSSYHRVNKIIFDEFIIDKGSSYYLRKEVEIFLELIETVVRMRDDFRGVFLIANAISFTNPYFLYFDVMKPKNKKMIKCKDDILIQFVKNEDFVEKKKKSRFGKLIEGTSYSKYSIDNEFLRDNEDFVKPIKGKMKYLFTLKSVYDLYGVWYCMDEGVVYVSKKVDRDFKIVYATKLENHQPNTFLLKGVGKSILFKTMIESFKQGLCFFDSVETKNVVVETVKNSL